MISSTFSIKAIASLLSIISATNAHMIMKTPIPYGRGVINNSPLDASGSDYPCKNLFDMTDPVNDVNHLVPGVPATLSFTGSAVHGGGSCQVALTSDLRPTKSSKWMVIKSIEGGCPASAEGNLAADPNGSGASTFQYTVPAGFPEGQYTISWVWYNKVGNREMYMNCGRASIANSKKRYAPAQPKIEHRAADYPDIFKANLAIFECKVPEGINVKFPNGGPDVQVVGAAQAVPGCGGSGSSSPSPDSGASSVAAGTTASRTASSAAAGAPTGGFASGSASKPNGGAATPTSAGFAHGSSPASKPTGNPGVFVPSAAAPSAPAATSAPSAQASASATVAPIPAAPSPSSGSSGGNGSSTPSTGSTTQGSKCSEEGAWMCSSDGSSFQRCASGVWSASMQVAAGTKCTPGQSMNLSMKVVTGSFRREVGSHAHGIAPHRRRALLLSE